MPSAWWNYIILHICVSITCKWLLYGQKQYSVMQGDFLPMFFSSIVCSHISHFSQSLLCKLELAKHKMLQLMEVADETKCIRRTWTRGYSQWISSSIQMILLQSWNKDVTISNYTPWLPTYRTNNKIDTTQIIWNWSIQFNNNNNKNSSPPFHMLNCRVMKIIPCIRVASPKTM
jgi:hypothetical protein